jgi:hypothetical protein
MTCSRAFHRPGERIASPQLEANHLPGPSLKPRNPLSIT